MAHERFSHSCFCKCLSPGTFAGSRGSHGTGLPLYLSLGFVDNPYNIGWEDTVGYTHLKVLKQYPEYAGRHVIQNHS